MLRFQRYALFMVIALGVLCSAGALFAADTEEETEAAQPALNHFQVNDDVSFGLNGYLYLYHIRNHNCYYNNGDAAFTEASAALGLDFDFRSELSGQIRIVGTGLFGRPENWLGVPPDEMKPVMDLANVTWHTKLLEHDFDLTAGLQEIIYGDGFLIMDGYSEQRAVWTTPLRSFPAIRGRFHLDETNWLDVFTAHVRDGFKSYESFLADGQVYSIRGSLTGTNLHIESPCAGTLDVGAFYKDESNQGFGIAEPSSDTLALDVREQISTGPLTFTGEIVREYGKTSVTWNGLGNTEMDRRAWGGHLTGQYDFDAKGSPYLKARYAYFGGDDDDSRTVEAFDPMFFGWGDWGDWYMGDMTSFEIVHNNARVIQLETGFEPTDVSKLRVIYFNTVLNENIPYSNRRGWSHEVNVVYDYYFSDYVFCGVMGGAAIPRAAAEDFNGDDKVNYEAIAWIGFSF